MNLFKKNITANSDSVKGKRADLLASATERQQRNLISELEQKIDDHEMKLQQLTDIAPENTYSLKPGGDNFDPNKWVREQHQIVLELYALNVELEIANKVYGKWFEEDKDSVTNE